MRGRSPWLKKLDALGRAVGALVELAGQRLDGEGGGSAKLCVGLLARQVELRLGKTVVQA